MFRVMHLFENMHKEYKGLTLRHLLWKAVRSTTMWEFNFHMGQMKEVFPFVSTFIHLLFMF